MFRTFDSREVNFEIDNEVEKLIKAKIETISILKIFISSFDNSTLMFEKIVETVCVVHQSASAEKEKKLNLKE